jgi:hypothetical protein
MDMVPISPAGTDLYGTDAEVPNGTVSYAAMVSDGSATLISDTVSAEMDHGGDYIMPLGRADLGYLVNVETLQKQTYAVDREVVTVLGRPDPVAVSYGRHWWHGSFTFLTLYDSERQGIERAMNEARVLVFAPREGAGIDDILYFSVGEVSEERVSAYFSEAARRWTLDVQTVARPPASYETQAIGNTWNDVFATGQTWGQIKLSETWANVRGF